MPHSCWGNATAGSSQFMVGSWGIVRTASANRNANQRSSQTADRFRFAFDGAPDRVEPVVVNFGERPREFIYRKRVAANLAEFLVRNIFRVELRENLFRIFRRAGNHDP